MLTKPRRRMPSNTPMRFAPLLLCLWGLSVIQMALLGARVEKTASTAEASFDKISAVGSTSKILLSQLEGLQNKTATEIPALEQKVHRSNASVDLACAPRHRCQPDMESVKVPLEPEILRCSSCPRVQKRIGNVQQRCW